MKKHGQCEGCMGWGILTYDYQEEKWLCKGCYADSLQDNQNEKDMQQLEDILCRADFQQLYRIRDRVKYEIELHNHAVREGYLEL